ncbi:MAG: short-chain dehydrogenase [Leptolyngbya foveolarum]|uniref:Short-chain dehydrogenase n=1 Tax=Leptolyngbya foveolarum TaxID=47253 RepID=A0A2W4W588_9CYAN|nr:MAG: short-chain dehydrogenase [Leptolyngbya foveolarum]
MPPINTPPNTPPNTLQRPVAIVTGASSGIGLAIARRLAADGYDLAICARREDKLAKAADMLRRQDINVLSQTVDLRNEAQILDFFAAVNAKWGQLDVLINNAGLGHKESLMAGKTAAWREMLEVNVLALCICTREAISLMQPANSGHILHVSSMSGHRVPAITGVYSASKFAVRSLTETLRRELRAANSNIRISSVSPGIVETEFAEKYHQSAEQAEKTYGQFPVLQAVDIANAIAYALSQPEHVEVNDILIRPTQQTS